jgi:hypothetical protein
VQCTALGFSALFHFVLLVAASEERKAQY